LEQIGSKVYDESVKTMQFNPSDYTNSSANMQRRLALERAIIVDDRAARQARKNAKLNMRLERRANGGGFGAWSKGLVDSSIKSALNFGPMLLNSTSQPSQSKYNLDSVDMEYVSTVLVPEDYQAR
jgi:hypothetical protein